MKNAFDKFITGHDIAKKSISEFEDFSTEIIQIKTLMEKKIEYVCWGWVVNRASIYSGIISKGYFDYYVNRTQ